MDLDGVEMFDDSSLPGFNDSSSWGSMDEKRQASFLSKLMKVKQARGETDTVSTVTKPPTTAARLESQRQQIEEKRQKIEELNRRIIGRDAGAVQQLRFMHSELGDDNLDDGSGGRDPLYLT